MIINVCLLTLIFSLFLFFLLFIIGSDQGRRQRQEAQPHHITCWVLNPSRSVTVHALCSEVKLKSSELVRILISIEQLGHGQSLYSRDVVILALSVCIFLLFCVKFAFLLLKFWIPPFFFWKVMLWSCSSLQLRNVFM